MVRDLACILGDGYDRGVGEDRLGYQASSAFFEPLLFGHLERVEQDAVTDWTDGCGCGG